MTHVRNPWQPLNVLAQEAGVSLGEALLRLIEAGLATPQAGPTATAKRGELARVRQGQSWLWHRDRLAPVLGAARQGRPTPQWRDPGPYASLTEIGARVQLRAPALGKRLERAGWRQTNAGGLPTRWALERALAQVQLHPRGFVVVHWHVPRTLELLAEQGWPVPDPTQQAISRVAHAVAHPLRAPRQPLELEQHQRQQVRRIAREHALPTSTLLALAAHQVPEHRTTLGALARQPGDALAAQGHALALAEDLPAGAARPRPRL